MGKKAFPLEVCSQKDLCWQNCSALSTDYVIALVIPIYHPLLLGLGQEVYSVSGSLTENV